jgi:hypothetical protein
MVIGWALSHHLKRNVALSAPSLPEITAGGELEAAGKGQTPGPEDTADGSSRPATPADEKDAKGGVKTCKVRVDRYLLSVPACQFPHAKEKVFM